MAFRQSKLCNYIFIFFLTLPLYHLSLTTLLFAEGTTAGNTVLQSFDAKPQSMAESYSPIPADEGGVVSLHYNHASLAFLKQPETSVTMKRGIAEDTLWSITCGIPENPDSHFHHRGILAGSFIYYSAGEIELTDNLGNSRTVQSQKDFAGNLSYARTLGRKVSLGINGKILRSELVESFSATAFAVDVGAMLRFQLLSFGMALQNVGTKLKYDRASDSLPLTFRIGTAYRMRWLDEHKSLVSIEFFNRKDESLKTNFGFEYTYHSMTSFRVGYKIGQDTGKVNFGAGFKVNRLRFDSCMQIIGDAGNAYFVSLGYLFGKIQPEENN